MGVLLFLLYSLLYLFHSLLCMRVFLIQIQAFGRFGCLGRGRRIVLCLRLRGFRIAGEGLLGEVGFLREWGFG